MSDKEKEAIRAMNKVVIAEANHFGPLFSAALLIAARTGDLEKMAELLVMAEKHRDNLARYIDESGEEVDAEVIGLWEYFAENAADIRKALSRKPKEDDEGEAWKQD